MGVSKIICWNGKGLVNEILLDFMVIDVNKVFLSIRIVESFSKGVNWIVFGEWNDGKGGSRVNGDGYSLMLECVIWYF